METKEFFTIFGFLIVIGTFMSLAGGGTGVVVGGDTVGSSTPINTTQLQAIPQVTNCVSAVPFWCNIVGVADSGSAIVAWLGAGLNFIWSGITMIVNIVKFFTGIGTLLAGNTIPQPIGYALALIIVVAWSFLALEIVRRFKSAVLPS